MRRSRTAILILMITAMVVGILVRSPLDVAAQDDLPWSATYYTTPDLSGDTFSRKESVLTYDWSTGPPLPGWPTDRFSARWTRTDVFSDGEYTFAARSDDGIRMYVDGQLIIDEWRDRQFEWVAVEKNMSAGTHSIVVEFYEDDGRAAIQAGYYPNFDLPSSSSNDDDDEESSNDNDNSSSDGGSGGSSSSGGGGGGSGSASEIDRPRAIEPLLFVPGIQGLPLLPPQGPVVLEDGVRVTELDPKAFSFEGFPGPVIRTGGEGGRYAVLKNVEDEFTVRVFWSLVPEVDGYYEIFAYLPSSGLATESALYEIEQGGVIISQIEVDQVAGGGDWLKLGSFYLEANTVVNLRLGNATGEPDASTSVLVDDVIFLFDPL